MSEPSASAVKPEPGAPPKLAAADSRWWRWGWIALAVALAGALVVLFGFNPSQHGFYPFCAFHRMTGMQCPGCGGLRAVHHLLHGEVLTAFRFNQLVVLAMPFAIWGLVRRFLRGPGMATISHRAQVRWAWMALVMVIFWIVRNLPLEMFRLPAE